MSTAANKIVIEQRENQSKIEQGVKFIRKLTIALSVAWIAMTAGLIFISSKHTTLLTESVTLKQADILASSAVEELSANYAGFKKEVDGFIDNYLPKNCELINTNLVADKDKNVIQTFIEIPNWESCQMRCVVNPECISWTYIKPGYPANLVSKVCDLKNNYGDREAKDGLVSGARDCKVMELLDGYRKIIDGQLKNTSEWNTAIASYKKYQSDLTAKKSFIYETSMSSPAPASSGNGSVAPTKAPFVCNVADVMWDIPAGTNSLLQRGIPEFTTCSDICISNPKCGYWTWFGNRNRRYRSNCFTYETYVLESTNFVKNRNTESAVSSERGCLEKRKRTGYVRYPEYHASFVGEGCHATGCNMAAAENTTLVKDQETIELCLSKCYLMEPPAYEATFLPMEYECYCHHTDLSDHSMLKYSFFDVFSSSTKQPLKYNLA